MSRTGWGVRANLVAMRPACAFVLFILSGLVSTPAASALCIYKGKMYAKTTIGEEFRDSKWVVRVRVLAANSQWKDYTTDVPWTIYSLSVVQSFKGEAPSQITMFTFRDSGGFYLDKGMSPDIGGEYLLFLDSLTINSDIPKEAYQSTEVNYSCGQSKPWSEVSASEKQELSRLARLQ